MTTMADIIAAEPTLSENNSRLCYANIITEQVTWRCYAPKLSLGGSGEVDKLVERFLRAHAMVPSLLGNHTLATEPMEIFACEWGEFTLHGGLYSNGAAVHVRHGNEYYNLLFIDDDTARTWGYPSDEFRFVAQPTTESDQP